MQRHVANVLVVYVRDWDIISLLIQFETVDQLVIGGEYISKTRQKLNVNCTTITITASYHFQL